jgi:hypothetical protein
VFAAVTVQVKALPDSTKTRTFAGITIGLALSTAIPPPEGRITSPPPFREAAKIAAANPGAERRYLIPSTNKMWFTSLTVSVPKVAESDSLEFWD